jgi:hypothetical protein
VAKSIEKALSAPSMRPFHAILKKTGQLATTHKYRDFDKEKGFDLQHETLALFSVARWRHAANFARHLQR